VDLTHTLAEGMPVAPFHSRFFHGLWDSPDTGSTAWSYQLVMNEHTGTHLDAPSHFVHPGAPHHQTVEEIDPSRFTGRAVTLDLSHIPVERQATADDLAERAATAAPVRPGDAVLLHFGWDRYWQPRSSDRSYTTRWPGIDASAARYLLEQGARTVGCDTLSVDGSAAVGSPAHHSLLGAGVLVLENLTRLGEILGESLLLAAPLKIADGSGAPLRALALVPAHHGGAQ
jgi:kynurenine formamidase